jgi:RHS repeat-associated protein
VTTTIPASDGKQGTGTRTFTLEYGYDGNYGRVKAIRYPSYTGTAGETVAPKYDERGILLGEVMLNADLSEGKRYRQVRGLTARGQVAEQRLGNCVRETGEYDEATGMVLSLTAVRPSPAPASLPALDLTACPSAIWASGGIRQGTYRYDRYLNLVWQTKNVGGVEAQEMYGYDEVQRLTSASVVWPGNLTASQSASYAYDDMGNLTSKSDYGSSYTYGSAARSTRNAGPHAVAEVKNGETVIATFTYDLNGNMTGGDGRSVTFDEEDRPVTVTTGAAASTFMYGPSGARTRQNVNGGAGGGFGPKTVYYVDKEYELTVWGPGSNAPGLVEERTFVGGSVVVLTSHLAAGGRTREVRYQHVDRLGSVEAATKEDAGATLLTVSGHGFDPWGRPRGEQWTSSGDRLHPGGEVNVESTRGFTGHEQLDAHWLTHMNGRVYDYRLGRFLSVDPIISNPGSTQSINPYSYIGNNPLSGTDPTGYCAEGYAAETGSRICRPMPTAEKLTAAIQNGIISAKTAVDDAASKVKATAAEVKDALSAGAAQFKAMLGVGSNGAGNGQGAKPNNTAPTLEGSPTHTARADQSKVPDPWRDAIRDSTASSPVSRGRGRTSTVLMRDDSGNVVVGANGAPVEMPAGRSAQEFVRLGEEAKGSTIRAYSNLANFKHGGPWDLQRTQGGFDGRFIDAATIAIGLYAAPAGIGFDKLMTIQDSYAGAFSKWKEDVPMHTFYTNLPVRNVRNTQIGYELYFSGAVTAGKEP